MTHKPFPAPSLLIQDFNLPKDFPSSWGRLAELTTWDDSWDPRDERSNADLANLLIGLSGKQLLKGLEDGGPPHLIWDGWALLLIGDPLPVSSCWKELLSLVGSTSQQEVLLVSPETFLDPKRLVPLLQKVGALLASGRHVMTFGQSHLFAPSILAGLAIMASAYPVTPEDAVSLWKGLREEESCLFENLDAGHKKCLSYLPYATLKASWDEDGARLYTDPTPRGGDYHYTERYRDSFLDDDTEPAKKGWEGTYRDPMQLVLNDVGVSGAICRLQEIIGGKGESFSPDDYGRWEIESLIGQVVKASLVHSVEFSGGGGEWPYKPK